jgi:Transglycosylase SLT domain
MYIFIYILIKIIHPTLSDAAVSSYANAINKQSDIDPLVFITIAEHESGFKANAISGDGEDRGLLQIRSRYYRGKPEWLLNGAENIRVGANVIRASQDFCRKYLNREPEYQEYLACFQGSCVGNQVCKPTKLTQQFADYTDCLQTQIASYADADFHSCRKIFDRKY